jgi:hypothetical protein
MVDHGAGSQPAGGMPQRRRSQQMFPNVDIATSTLKNCGTGQHQDCAICPGEGNSTVPIERVEESCKNNLKASIMMACSAGVSAWHALSAAQQQRVVLQYVVNPGSTALVADNGQMQPKHTGCCQCACSLAAHCQLQVVRLSCALLCCCLLSSCSARPTPLMATATT